MLRRRQLHQQSLLEVGTTRIPLLYLSPLVFILIYFYTVFPESDKVYDFYFFGFTDRDGIFRRQLVSKQTYVDYLAWRIAMVFIFFTIFHYADKYRKQLRLFAFLWLGFLFDYIIIYNQPVFYYDLGCIYIPMSYSFLMAVVIGFAVLLTISKQWKP